MKIHRFYIEGRIADDSSITLSKEVSHQISRVLRLSVGETVIIFDGHGFEWVSEIVSVTKQEVVVKPMHKNKCAVPTHHVTLAQAIIKKDNFEWITEKATELGVAKIIPVVTERSEKKEVNLERLKIISKEASEQSGRGDLVEILEVQKLEQFVSSTKNLMVFHIDGEMFKKDLIQEGSVICIGPEGGWSEKEVEMFRSHGAKIVSMGSLVLRAETAAISALSLSLL
jgi:16S rRNA (uracil1498-N3)-methyltransferase